MGSYSDIDTIIGEDQSGVGGCELGVRHCEGLRLLELDYISEMKPNGSLALTDRMLFCRCTDASDRFIFTARFASRSEICAANALIGDPHLQTMLIGYKAERMGHFALVLFRYSAIFDLFPAHPHPPVIRSVTLDMLQH